MISRQTVELIVRVVATVAAFVLAVAGFYMVYSPAGGADVADFLDYAYKSVQLVVGKFPTELEDQPLPLPLQIARFALPAVTAWTTITVIWLKARNPLRVGLIRVRGDHLIVTGDDTLAAQIVAAERRRKRGVMIWADNTHLGWVEAAADLGAPSIPRAGADGGLSKLGLDKARGLLVAGPDDAANVPLAAAALDRALEVRPPSDPLIVIARVDDPDLRGPLERRFDRAGERPAARLRFASLPDIAARQLFLRHPLDRFRVGEDRTIRIFLFGFSPTAERYAVRVLAGVHMRGGLKPQMVALDPDAATKAEVFKARRPGAAQLSPFSFETAPVDQPALVSQTLKRAIAEHGAPTSIIVDPAGSDRALAVALAVEEHFRTERQIAPPIFVRIGSTEPQATDPSCLLTGFGGAKDLADPEALLQEDLDALARSVHEFYFEGRLEEGDVEGSRASMHEWDRLPEAVRDDNRLVADCFGLKLRDVGQRLVAGSGGAGPAFTPEELEELSRAEHDRWMAAKLVDGWVWGEARDDARKLHPDIVPYDDLSEARKDLDREQIRIISRLLGSSGRQAIRDLVLVIDEGVAAVAAGLPAVLAEFKTRYPDRAVVLLGAFEDAASRAALTAGRAAGLPVRVCLTRNAHEALEALPRTERAAAAGLLRESDQILALPQAEWPTERRRAFLRSQGRFRLGGEAAASDPEAVAVDAVGRIVSAPWTR